MSDVRHLASPSHGVKASNKKIYTTNDYGVRLNVGCGETPTTGWVNYDNSPSLRNNVASTTISTLCWLRVLPKEHMKKIQISRKYNVKWANVFSKIPEKNASVQVIYTSHMLEHIHRNNVKKFLDEAYRVLEPRGILRIVVPDLEKIVNEYVQEGDADKILHRLNFYGAAEETLLFKLNVLLFGFRGHHWMYDSNSLCKILKMNNFIEPTVLNPGETLIESPGSLDLYERSHESVYVEARKP